MRVSPILPALQGVRPPEAGKANNLTSEAPLTQDARWSEAAPR
jgi:hypothetical protein